jgi:hypothetical protein
VVNVAGEGERTVFCPLISSVLNALACNNVSLAEGQLESNTKVFEETVNGSDNIIQALDLFTPREARGTSLLVCPALSSNDRDAFAS